jgi:ubiquitin fusion degradation protein 1
MIKTLKMRSNELVELTNVALPVGTFIKIQPQSVDFLDITDPRAVLEHSLRNFATLTVGDCVAVNYNQKIYELLVMEVKPNDGRGGISVLETDLQVEFAAPLGYQEAPLPKSKSEKSIVSIERILPI